MTAGSLPDAEARRRIREDLDATLQQLKNFVDYTEQDLKRFRQSSKRRRPFDAAGPFVEFIAAAGASPTTTSRCNTAQFICLRPTQSSKSND